MRSEVLNEMLESLGHGLVTRLEAQGWIARERVGREEPDKGVADELESFTRSLGEGFDALAMFCFICDGEFDRVTVVGGIGIEYRPARELLARLTGSEIRGAMLKQPNVEAQLERTSEVAKAAERLAAFVDDGTRQVARLANIDRIVGLMRERSAVAFAPHMAGFYAMDVVDSWRDDAVDPDTATDEMELTAALLAGAGRYREAREALAANCVDASVLQEHRRFVRQLARFLDAEGRLVLPITPPRWPPDRLTPGVEPSPLQRFTDAISESTARREAVDAVRIASYGKARHELWVLLEKELSTRGLSMDMRSAEATIDVLMTEHEPFGAARVVLRGAERLMGKGPERVEPKPGTRHRDLISADEREAAILALPDRAGYPLGYHLSTKRATVELDPTRFRWLSHIADQSMVQVWLTWDADSPVAEEWLNVYIGSRRVGRLGSDTAECFRPAMEAAAERNEDPWTYAYLKATLGAMPYALTVGLPHTDASGVS